MKGFRGDEACEGGGGGASSEEGAQPICEYFHFNCATAPRIEPPRHSTPMPLPSMAPCPRPFLMPSLLRALTHNKHTHTYTVKTGIPKTQTQGQNQNTEDSSERSRVPLGSHVPGKANPSIAGGGWKAYGFLIWSPCRQAGTQNVTWRDDLCMQRVFGQQSPVLSPHTHTHTYLWSPLVGCPLVRGLSN